MANEEIYLGNLPFSVTEAELLELTEPFGSVVRVIQPKDFETQRGRGFAFIIFDFEESAFKAIMALDGIMFQDRVLKAARAKPRIGNSR
ncbi:MAG: RNA-binding protein [Candidatus Aminicenantes bacterium]|nr:RNA-binding protein [Candidatus Aminicenantes bacterium]